MAVNFIVQFRINEKTQSRVLRLTDNSTGFTLAKGNFSVTFPDGSTRIKTDFNSPDITTSGGYVDISLVTDASDVVLTGSYKIDFVALDGANTSYPLTRNFDFNWIKPVKNIVSGTDVLVPEVKFYDNTSYSPTGNFTGTLSRTFSTLMPSNTPQSGTNVIGVGNLINPVFSGNYYEGIYTVKSDVSVNYTHTSSSWLTVFYTDLLQEIIDVQRAPTQTQLIVYMNTYHAAIEAYENKNDTQFNILNEQYDLVVALYSHIIARYESGTLDGSEPLLAQLLDILRPYNVHTYTSAPLIPFTLDTIGTTGFVLSDGTTTDNFSLGETLRFASNSTALTPVVSNNAVSFNPTFGVTPNTFASGSDSRFHDAVTLGASTNGLSLSTQQLSLAVATTSVGGAMSAVDKAKLDGIAAGAQTGTVTSIGISMPSAFTVSNSPVTTFGTIAITAAGSSAEYIRGDGATGNFNSAARGAISLTTTGTSGAATYSSSTGVLNIPQYQGGVTSFNTRTGAITLTSGDVTTALTFTPYNATNPSNYIALTALSAGAGISYNNTTGVIASTITQYTDALARLALTLTTTGTSGAATYNSTTGVLNIPSYQGGVTSFNTRTGAITLTSGDVTGALGFTPYNATNPAGYTTNVGTVTSVGGTGTVSGLTLTGSVSVSGNLTLGGTLSLTSGNITSGLGFTPENAANKGVAGGYASLDGGGLVPSTQLPSYVDDVLEYTNLAGFPASGTTGKIYVALDTNKIYRWSGSAYIEVSPTVGTIWGGITGTLSNQTDLQTALNAKQATITLTTTGTSGAATFVGNTLNIPQYQGGVTSFNTRTGAITLSSSDVTTALGYTPVTNARTLTINGTTYDLTANRSWTISGAMPTGGTAGQILSKIDATDYNTIWIDNFASQLKHEVKLGATIAKGKAVYVSSADGTNMIVSAASNASEATSSKTLGLLETGGVTNDIVKVVTEGLLAGLDTSTATAGDPVWLGTNGDLLFGLANKPVAPAHLVFIGIVTRVQSNNGEIFVKVQNGFELNEIHDVLVGSYGTKDVLYRDTATNLWKNGSIASILGYTPYDAANPSNYIALTALSSTATGLTYTNTTGVFSLTSGYVIPTTTSATNWDTAYTNRITTLTTTGTSGAATLTGNTLNIPQYQSVLTNPVTGTGTTNYVPKFTGTSALGNSLIYDNGTSVIIGGTSSSANFKLSVEGNSNLAGDTNIGGFIYGNFSKTLPTGNTFAGQTININGSADGWGLVNRNSWNINDDAFTTNGFTIYDNRLFLNRSTTSGISWTNTQAIITNNGTASQTAEGIISTSTGTGSFNNFTAFRAGANGTPNNTNSYTNYYGFRVWIIPNNNVTNAYGLIIDSSFNGSSLTRAIDLNVTAGTGKWNIYAGGTANNYLAGSLGIGSTALTGTSLRISKTITGATNSIGIYQDGAIQSDVTNNANYFSTYASIQNTAFTLGNLTHYRAGAPATFTGATVTNQNGFFVESGLTGATNNYGFRGQIASGTGRWNLYMDGTANNYLAGNLGIGTTSISDAILKIQKAPTGASSMSSVFSLGTVQSDVTSSINFNSLARTQAATFTLTSLTHFNANQDVLGAGSAITTQTGFLVNSSLTGATNNIGFRGQIPVGTNRWNIYMDGTASNFIQGVLSIGTSSPNASAKVQIDSTSQGFLPPRMTAAQRGAIASPEEGLIVFQTDETVGLYVYASAAWHGLTML